MQSRIATHSNTFLEDLLRSQGYSFVGSDGSVPSLDFREKEKSDFPRHRFKEYIEMHAPIARQIKDDPYAGVATLTKKEANAKIRKSERIKNVSTVVNSLRQLDKLVAIYVKRTEALKETPTKLFARFISSRMQKLSDLYADGDHKLFTDWGEPMLKKHGNEISLETKNYHLKITKDEHFNAIELNLSPDNPDDKPVQFYIAN